MQLRVIVSGLLLCLGLLAPRSARAQDATGEAYTEARAFVDELITTEFAESSTVWLTCRTGYLPRYFTRSLRRLRERQWGDLRTTLRDESINLATDALYVAAKAETSKVPGAKTSASIRDFILCRETAATGTAAKCITPAEGDEGPGTINQNLKVAGEKAELSLKAVCDLALSPATPDRAKYRDAILRMIDGDPVAAAGNVFAKELKAEVDACTATGDDPACPLVSALKAALQNKPAAVESDLMTFVTIAFLPDDAEWKTGHIPERTRDLLLEWLRRDKSDHGRGRASGEILNVLRGLSPDQLDCKAESESAADVLVALASADTANPETLGKLACFATSDVVAKMGEVQIELSRKGATVSDHKVSVQELVTRYARRASLDHGSGDALPTGTGEPRAPLNEREMLEYLACLPVDKDGKSLVDCTAGSPRPEALDGVSLKLGTARWTVSTKGPKYTLVPVAGAPSPALTALVTAADQVRSLRQILQSRLTALFGAAESDIAGTRLRTLTAHALRVDGLLRDLRKLRLASDGEHLDTSSLFEATLKVVAESATLCGTPETGRTKSCGKIAALSAYLKEHNDEIARIVAAAERHDYKAVALDTLRVALPAGADDESPASCSLDSPSYKRLTLTFASYILSENGASSDREINRQMLRSAAVETLRCMSTSGLDRKASTPLQHLAHTFFRDVALRASWSQGYRSQSSPDGYRTVLTASALTLHPRLTSRNSSVYVGLELSAVDWLAPLNELALRKADAGYNNEEALLLSLIRPRADVVLGLPVLSEHLAASVGFSVLPAAPYRGRPGEAPSAVTETEFTYLPIWSDDPRVKQNRAPFAELSVGVHYVF